MNQQLASNVNNLISQGIKLHEAGQLLDAEKIYMQCISVNPENARAMQLLGVLKMQGGQLNEAKELISKAISLDPINCVFYDNLANIYRMEGNHAEAVVNYKKAIEIKPNYIGALHNLGNILRDINKNAEAIKYYKKVVEIDPKHITAWGLLGGALLAIGKTEDAMEAYNEATKRMPNNIVAWANLGIALTDLGRHKEAIEAYNKGLKIDSKKAELYSNRASVYQAISKMGKALADYQKAIELQPTYATPHCNLGNIYLVQGKFSEAEVSFKKAIVLRPDYAEAYYHLLNTRKFTDSEDDIKIKNKMEELASSGKLTGKQAAYLNYARSKYFEDVGQYPLAFTCLKRGAEFKRSTINYNKLEEDTLADNLIKQFPAELFTKLEAKGYEDKTPIFIVGMPRSGTSLVEQIISSHPAVCGAGELSLLQNAVQNAEKSPKKIFPNMMASINGYDLKKIGKKYIKDLREHIGDNEITHISNKMPANFTMVGLIKLALPNAKIIHCKRNPMDTCLSCLKQLFNVGQPFSYNLDELGDYYNIYRKVMNHWDKIMGDNIYHVSYEDIVANTETEAHKLISHLGLEWDNNCLEFYKNTRLVHTASATQVRKPIYKTSIKGWKRYEQELQPLFEVLQKGGSL